MVKRLAALVLGMLTLLSMQLPVAALGFYDNGGYTDTTREYSFETGNVWQVYNKELINNPNYAELWSGSVLYLPIRYYDTANRQSGQVTDKMVKDDNIEVSYVITRGAQLIDSIELIDGRRDRVNGLPAGSYVRIQITSNYSGTGYTQIGFKLVLSVNRVSYQETRVEFTGEITNREEIIDDNSVYGAKVPTRFRVENYDGAVMFDMGDGITYSAFVRRFTRYTINLNRDPDYDISNMYPDAHMQFYNFLGNSSTFASVGTLRIPINRRSFHNNEAAAPRVFAYEILGNNQLRSLGSDVASYDSRNSVLTIRTTTLSNYVLSNQSLLREVDPARDDTFQSGYATREEDIAPIEEPPPPTQTATPAPQQPSTTQPSTAAPPTTPADDTPPILAPENPTANPMTGPPPTAINVSNSRGDNPLTGGGAPYGMMALGAAFAPVCLRLWKMKPFRKIKK